MLTLFFFLAHFFCCFFFFTRLRNFVLQHKEGKTQTGNIHYSHAYSKQRRRSQSNVLFIWELNPKMWIQMQQTHKERPQ